MKRFLDRLSGIAQSAMIGAIYARLHQFAFHTTINAIKDGRDPLKIQRKPYPVYIDSVKRRRHEYSREHEREEGSVRCILKAYGRPVTLIGLGDIGPSWHFYQIEVECTLDRGIVYVFKIYRDGPPPELEAGWPAALLRLLNIVFPEFVWSQVVIRLRG